MAIEYYVDTAYSDPFYANEGVEVLWESKIIFVPKSVMPVSQTVPSEIRTLNVYDFHGYLRDLEASDSGVLYQPMHTFNPALDLGGVTLAPVVSIINGYTIVFEDGQYAANIVGGNSNIADVVNLNQVSVRSANSAGLQNVSTPTNVVTGTALTAEQTAAAVWGATIRTLTSTVEGQNVVADLLASTEFKQLLTTSNFLALKD